MRNRHNVRKIDIGSWARGFGPLRIELTNEEILADLRYPGRAVADRRGAR